jgi:hypothetical protein
MKKEDLFELSRWAGFVLLMALWAAVAMGMAFGVWYGAKALFPHSEWAKVIAGPIAAFMGMFGPLMVIWLIDETNQRFRKTFRSRKSR